MTPLEALLGATLTTSDGGTIDTATLANKKTICLYFSAHWCGPCRGFTPKLAAAWAEYKKAAGDDADAELVFVSWDRSEDSFKEYHAEMTFPAVNFAPELCSGLGDKFGVQGIPSLVALSPSGDIIHSKDSGVDLRSLIDKHGAAAFPLSTERVSALKAEAAVKADAALAQLYDGTIKCMVKAPGGGSEISLNDLLGRHEHVGLCLGDGDSTDSTYAELAETVEKVNADKAARQVVVYVAWELYEGGDHAPFADKYHSILDLSDELKTTFNMIASGEGRLTLLNLRKGSGVCGMDGKCEAEGVPVLTCLDAGLRRIRTAGAAGYPWSDAKMEEVAAEEKSRVDALKARQTNLEFLKTHDGQDTQLVRTKFPTAPTVAIDLASLGEEGIVGLYFSAHWCPPCRRFTPQLVKCYEDLKAQGKKFEVVFVSSDKDEAGFEEYCNEMVTSKGDQLIALDYANRQLKTDLSKIFDVEGIPTLVLLKPDGTVITEDGTSAVSFGAEYFPWDAEDIKKGEADAADKQAAVLKVAVDQEKEAAVAQRAAGDTVMQRMIGIPGCIEHNHMAKTIKFLNFATAGAPEALTTSGVLYYEIQILKSEGIPQVGFSLKDGTEISDERCGEGCGDNASSWAVDGTRQVKWHKGDAPKWKCSWATDDVIGLAANIDLGKIAVSKNGVWTEDSCGVVFVDDTIKSGVFPCLTGGGYQVRYAFSNFTHAAPAAEIWAGVAAS